MNEMKIRIITSIFAICIFLPVLYFSDTMFFCFAMAVVAVASVYEMMRCMGIKKLYITIPVCLWASVFPFLVRYITNIAAFAMIAFICGGVYIMYLFTLSLLSHGKFQITEAATLFTVSLYIIAAITSIVYIRDFRVHGEYIYLLVFIGAWVTDSFAYFTGMFIGKHKLIPDVSPKKTIEGSIGGIVFCTAAFVGFGIVTDAFFGTSANLIFLALGGVIVSVISQIGDLVMSLIKRHYGIKDYGKIFPGHGGMLDRFDSILAVSLGVASMCMITSLTGINIL